MESQQFFLGKILEDEDDLNLLCLEVVWCYPQGMLIMLLPACSYDPGDLQLEACRFLHDGERLERNSDGWRRSALLKSQVQLARKAVQKDDIWIRLGTHSISFNDLKG